MVRDEMRSGAEERSWLEMLPWTVRVGGHVNAL